MQYAQRIWRSIQYAVAMAACGLAAAVMVWADVYPFLAVNRPVAEGDVLVVEGWMPDYAIEAAAAEFRRGPYRLIVTMGFPVMHGSHLTSYSTFADLSAATLVALGIDPKHVVALPHSLATVRRTASTAIALRQGLEDAGVIPKAVNLYSLGPHARRTWELCRAALPPEVQVGVLAVTPQDYDPSCWWRTSSGARAVFGELVAYTHLRLSQPLNQVL